MAITTEIASELPPTVFRMGPVRQSKKRATERQLSSGVEGESYRLKAYDGKNHKLVVAIDVGTTFSAASFCILKPGDIPVPEFVSSWPGQAMPDLKVPTILYYDKFGTPKLWGAETMDDDRISIAERENWIKVEWFKLALRPQYLSQDGHNTLSIPNVNQRSLPTLPVHIPVEKAYSDFLLLMLGHIKSYFCKHYASGKEIWDKLFPNMDVIFTIPNGWEIKQQHQIRSAAVNAGFFGLPGDERNLEEGMRRVHFLSEPEAAINYAAAGGRIDSWLQEGNDVMLCDVGGLKCSGTIDITPYTINRKHPLQLKERLPSQCIIAGAVFINQEARRYLSDRLRGTPWNTKQKLDDLLAIFEQTIKQRFGSQAQGNELYGLGHAGAENIPQAGVSNGRVYIKSADVAKFFDPTLDAIKAGIDDMYQKSGKSIKNVVVVGGLMNSSYAFSNLETWGGRRFQFSKPDGSTAKAVSQGALQWFLSSVVTSHVAKFHYGTDVSPIVGDCDMDWTGRQLVMRADGVQTIPDVWSTIVEMGQSLEAEKPITRRYEKYMTDADISEDSEFREEIFVCRKRDRPNFTTVVDMDGTATLHPDVEKVCSVVVDLEAIFDDTRYENELNDDGEQYKILDFHIGIISKGCEMKAFARWRAKNRTRSGEAKILPG